MTEDIFSILEKMDSAFQPHLGEVLRSISCKKCLEEGTPGYFDIQEGVKFYSETKKCSEAEHFLPQKLTGNMRKKQKPFEMKNLLAVEKSSLNLQPFRNSQIKEDMLSGNLKLGEQIWVYHDSVTNPWNPVAYLNKYAHVVIYVGKREGIHEVVHISAAPITRGLMKAKIRKQNIMEVIKPRDQIFLGHKIPDCVVSANLQDEIVRRALKCTEKPSIVFDYHYR